MLFAKRAQVVDVGKPSPSLPRAWNLVVADLAMVFVEDLQHRRLRAVTHSLVYLSTPPGRGSTVVLGRLEVILFLLKRGSRYLLALQVLVPEALDFLSDLVVDARAREL